MQRVTNLNEFSLDELSTLLDEYEESEKATPKIDIGRLCFEKQKRFIEDESSFVSAVTSRRAGKTTACGIHLLHTATKFPNTVSLYITFARTDAKGILWPILHELNRSLDLKAIANEADLTWKFANGSMIRLGGAATSEEINRYRGYAVKLAYIDEVQRLGNYVSRLVDDVLVYACADHKGQIRLIGTPSSVPVGYFYNAAANEGDEKDPRWSRHHWNMFDNPWLEKKRGESPKTLLEQEMQGRGVPESDPTIQREFFGRFVVDPKKLVLTYSPIKNHYDELPKYEFHHIIGIDLGFKDADAICVLGHTNRSSTTYLVDELVTHKQGLTELFNQVERLRKVYQPYKIVIDTGGLGLKIAESMRSRYLIPVQAAEKTRKFENIELLNDAMRVGKFMAKRDSLFANDAMLLEWDQDRERPDKKVVSDRFHSDIVDAALYAFRESPAYSYAPPIAKPKYGSKEWADDEVRDMERLTEERLKSDLLIEEVPSDSLEYL